VGSISRVEHWRRKRSDLARRIRLGEEGLATELEEVKKQQAILDAEKTEALLYEQRRPDLIDVVKLDRIALAIVVPDPTPEAREAFDKDIEAIAMRIARNFEIDHYQARVFRCFGAASRPRLRPGEPSRERRQGRDRGQGSRRSRDYSVDRQRVADGRKRSREVLALRGGGLCH